jgi:hypothetical protein
MLLGGAGAELAGLILTARFDEDVAGDDEPGTAGCEIPIQCHQRFGRGALRCRHRFGSGRADQAVLERQPADTAGREKRQVIGYGRAPLRSSSCRQTIQVRAPPVTHRFHHWGERTSIRGE